MNRRAEQDNDRRREDRSGNRDMGQSRDSMYRGAYRFDDHRSTRDQYGDVHDQHRDDRGRADQHNTEGASPNYGNMGSYGGSQGFGSSRGGYGHPAQDRSGFDATSGHGPDEGHRSQPDRQLYGAYWDRNSFNENDRDRFSREHRSQHQERNRYNIYDRNREEDSRYEIYDTHQRQYNEGSYTNDVRINPSFDFNRDMEVHRGEQDRYGSHQRAKVRQGDGNDQDRRYTSDLQEGNMAGSLSWGYDGHRGDPDQGRHQRYDPISGQARRDDRHPDDNRRDDNRREERNRPRGGYDANNMSPDERHRNR
jgi:hypothetical protein